MVRRTIIIFLAILFFTSNSNAQNLRVISLYPGHSDNIYALSRENNILIALSENDDNDLLQDLPRISLRANAEKLLALNPDVVITRPFAEKLNPNLYNVLKISGVKIISLEPPKWENFPDYLKTLAQELNLNPEFALQKLEIIKNNISQKAHEKIASGKKIPVVFIESTSREIHTCTPDSWAANLIKLAGAKNYAENVQPLRNGSSVAPFGIERVLKSLDNGLNIYIIQNGAMNNTSLKDFYSRHWTEVFKTKNIKVAEIPEKYLSRPSLLGLEIGGDLLLKLFYE